ncbi:MAG TPA: DUF732 domain-containing protein [Acidimicrobiales bacterium]|nr:DUF732 domain-containing protein [Acidimicrobiales bacterium]
MLPARGVVAAATVATGLVLAAAGCGHKPAAPKENTALFLTLSHTSLAMGVGARSDADLLALGRRACTDLDKGLGPDQVVADLSGNAEPGSAAFNEHAFIAAAAARSLCPRHEAEFSSVPGLQG